MNVFPHRQFERAPQRRFYGGGANLAVALSGMAVPDGEQRAFVEHWEKQGRARLELLVVHVPPELARDQRSHRAISSRRRIRQDSEKRRERQARAPRQSRRQRLAVKRNV